MKGVRHQKKNYLLSLVITLGLWLLLSIMIWRIDPKSVADWGLPQGYLAFFLLLFLAVFFSFSLLLASTRRGLLSAIGVVVAGYLRLWRIGNWLSIVFLFGVLMMIELYFWGKSDTTANSDADFDEEIK